MNNIAIIPARGGSKGIPRKNLRLLAGKPLVAHTIDHACQALSVSRVVVSTDDQEIAAVAQRYGAEVVWRPAEISGDTASSESALLHALDFLKQAEDYDPDLVVFLQCTSPLTVPGDIDGTIHALLENNADTALTVAPFHYFLWKQEDGDATGINHDKRVRPRRQDRETQYVETGAVYVMRVQGFRETGHRFFGKTATYVVPAERRLEIDEPADLLVAETLMREQEDHRKALSLPEPVAALVLDFDGVFTDNRVVVLQDGQEAVICNRSDGLGLSRIKQSGIPILVLSTEANPVVSARSQKLGLDCTQGVADKRAALKSWLQQRGLNSANTVYIGNDINDLECIEFVGCGVAVGDSHPVVKRSARIVLSNHGGHGAIREICDLIAVRNRGKPGE